MRAVLQRVRKAKVEVDEMITGEIKRGLIVFIGVEKIDQEQDAVYLAAKTANLRIFENDENKMSVSAKDIQGEILAVSQFTLLGDCRKGRRPDFSSAASPDLAKKLYEIYIENLEQEGLKVARGCFGENMLVSVENDGPVTIILDSKKSF